MINAIQNIGGLSSIQGLDGTSSTSSAASTAQAMLGGTSAVGKTQSFADVMGSMASDMVGSMKKPKSPRCRVSAAKPTPAKSSTP